MVGADSTRNKTTLMKRRVLVMLMLSPGPPGRTTGYLREHLPTTFSGLRPPCPSYKESADWWKVGRSDVTYCGPSSYTYWPARLRATSSVIYTAISQQLFLHSRDALDEAQVPNCARSLAIQLLRIEIWVWVAAAENWSQIWRLQLPAHWQSLPLALQTPPNQLATMAPLDLSLVLLSWTPSSFLPRLV